MVKIAPGEDCPEDRLLWVRATTGDDLLAAVKRCQANAERCRQVAAEAPDPAEWLDYSRTWERLAKQVQDLSRLKSLDDPPETRGESSPATSASPKLRRLERLRAVAKTPEPILRRVAQTSAV